MLTDQSASSHIHTHTLIYRATNSSLVCISVFVHTLLICSWVLLSLCISGVSDTMLNPRPLLSSKSFLYFTCRRSRGNETLHVKGTVTLWKRLCGSVRDTTRSIFDVLQYLARPRLSHCCTKTNTSSASPVEYFHAYTRYFQCTSVFTLTSAATWRAQQGWTWNAGATLLSLNRWHTEESWKPLNYFQPAGGLH